MRSELLSSTAAAPEVPMDLEAVRAFFGGTKPLHPATVYRHVRRGIIPPPYHVGALSRWDPAKCAAAREALVEGRAR
jgi:hypothetical protein